MPTTGLPKSTWYPHQALKIGGCSDGTCSSAAKKVDLRSHFENLRIFRNWDLKFVDEHERTRPAFRSPTHEHSSADLAKYFHFQWRFSRKKPCADIAGQKTFKFAWKSGVCWGHVVTSRSPVCSLTVASFCSTSGLFVTSPHMRYLLFCASVFSDS